MSALLTFAVFAFGVGGAFYWLSMRGKPARYQRQRWIKYSTFLGVVLAAILAWRAGPLVLMVLVAAISVRGAIEINAVQSGCNKGKLPTAVWLAYLLVSALAVIGTFSSSPDTTIFVFVVVATFDGGSQVSGQLFGHRKLSPRISPNKTIEGLVGGLVMACVAAVSLDLLSPLSGHLNFLVGIPLGLVALAGDLSASWIKRRSEVKDFPSILPGHGGVLDRFDGLLPNLAILGVLAALGLNEA